MLAKRAFQFAQALQHKNPTSSSSVDDANITCGSSSSIGTCGMSNKSSFTGLYIVGAEGELLNFSLRLLLFSSSLAISGVICNGKEG